MSSDFGKKIHVTLFGQSHSEGLGTVIDGLPAGFELSISQINAFLDRRRANNKKSSTTRHEKDGFKIISGLFEGKTCGAPLCAIFENNDCAEDGYKNFTRTPRPSHADYAAQVKYNGFNDYRGGGHFSGRLTLPLCFAGSICLQILQSNGISVNARIIKTGDIESAAEAGDSVGGIIECVIEGLSVGLGEPMFDGIENVISSAVFAIPAVKGIEFGSGFGGSMLRGSQNNDAFYYDNGKIKTSSNNSGGINGGITNGMPVVFRVAVKPVPSISIKQKTVDLVTEKESDLTINGRHDVCIVPRALPCVEAAAAIAIIQFI